MLSPPLLELAYLFPRLLGSVSVVRPPLSLSCLFEASALQSSSGITIASCRLPVSLLARYPIQIVWGVVRSPLNLQSHYAEASSPKA